MSRISHRYDRDAPRTVFFVEDILDLTVQLLSPRGNFGQIDAPHRITQRCLRGPPNGRRVVLYLDAGVFGIPHHPEQHGIDIERHKVGGQRLLRRERRGDHALVNVRSSMFYHGNDEIKPRASNAVEVA